MAAMTRAEAEQEASRMFSTADGKGIGQVRWRRRKSPRFSVVILYTDGRMPSIMGESNVDWESAFHLATLNRADIGVEFFAITPTGQRSARTKGGGR